LTEKNKDLFDALELLMRKRYYGWVGADQFKGTGSRIRRLIDEFCWENDKIEGELDKVFKDSAKFMAEYDEMLVEGPINVWTLCPHHLVPCNFKVYTGYIPTKLVLGLSKFARAAVVLAKRPIIQEQYTQELADEIQSRLNPKGVGVYVIGSHGCMCARGIKQDEAKVSTSVLKGAIMDRVEARAEFYSIARGGNHVNK